MSNARVIGAVMWCSESECIKEKERKRRKRNVSIYCVTTGTTFISSFWPSLFQASNIRNHFSTAYHPQTDGQTERTNQNLEQYLQIYINYDQDNWEQLLLFAEFVHNNTPNAATGISPFFSNKGYNP